MLDFSLPHDDAFPGDEEDSSGSTVIRSSDVHEFHRRGGRIRRNTAADSKRLALARARYFKRKYAIERTMAVAMFVVASPFIAALIALVRMTSKGPGIYRQQRVGMHGEVFYVYKLRSMRVDAEKGGKPVWCSKKDSRVTRVGKFLRSTHLDELPQLWNVVKGEMSLTGPRPERPEICEVLSNHIDDYYDRTVVKPGVTGLAQINLEPDETIADVKRKQFLDMHYIENAGFWLDARMLVATGLRVFFIKGERAMRMMKLCHRDLVNSVVETFPEDERGPFDDSTRVAGEATRPAQNHHPR